ELVADSLDAVPADLVPGAQRRGVCRLERMRLDSFAEAITQVLGDSHDSSARADARDEPGRPQTQRGELRGDLRPRGFVMRLHVGGVVELLRAEHTAALAREIVCHTN